MEILEQFLRHPDYKTLTVKRFDANPDVLDGFLKGSYASENQILREHPDALRLVEYYDDLEICAGLSSYASGKSKLGAF